MAKHYDPNLSWEENCARAAKVKTNFPRVQVISDIEPYRSPVDGGYVGGRVSQRDQMKRHDCVPYERSAKTPKGFGNPKYAAKHGLKLNEAAVHRQRAKRIDPREALKDIT